MKLLKLIERFHEMATNPSFLPNINPENYAIRLLTDTIGVDEIPINVFEIPEWLKETGLKLFFNYHKFKNNDEAGLTEISKTEKIIYLNANIYGDSFEEVLKDNFKRKHCRFTLAHELGHCYIPSHIDVDNQNRLTDPNNMFARKYSFKKEYEANIFAAELLIPTHTVKRIYSKGNNCREIAETIAKEYDTSFMAAILKVANLCNDSICVCLQIDPKTKKILNLRWSKEFSNYGKGLFIDRQSCIREDSIANSIANGDLSLNGKSRTDYNPTCWFPNFRGNLDAKIFEWSCLMGNNIITFLEIEDSSLYSLHL